MSQTKWQNWAHNQQCDAKTLTPNTTDELITIIKQARKEKATVHAYGSSHSWSDIVCVNDYLINTDRLNKLLLVDSIKNQVTVQAGIKLKDLNAKLAKLGLCLSNQGAITRQSLAGVVSTATHGSGRTGTFASFITQVKLLTADGTVNTISADTNKELWSAVRTSIGSLGIITELTVQCEPLFKLKRETKKSNWQTVMKGYQKLLQNNDYMEFYWDAFDDSVQIITNNRVPNKTKIAENVDYSFKTLSGTLRAIYIEEEIAVPTSRFVEAANEARKLIQDESNKSEMFDGILFRFVSAEKQNYLSPAAGRDVVYFSVTTSARTGYDEFFKKLYDLLIKYNGRPHWGKINYLTYDDTKKLYGKKLDKFIAVRKKFDPVGMFSNQFTKRIFGW